MRALTLWPEWAWCIAHAGKRVENRTWPPPIPLGTRIAIHAGAKVGGTGTKDAIWRAKAAIYDIVEDEAIVKRAVAAPTSAIVATAVLTGGRRVELDGSWRAAVQPDQHRWVNQTPGTWLWLLDDVQVLPEPIPTKGALGLWDASRYFGGTP